jgi:hypothetical protein
MKIHKPTIISLSIIAIVYLVMSRNGDNVLTEDKQTSTKVQNIQAKSDVKDAVKDQKQSAEIENAEDNTAQGKEPSVKKNNAAADPKAVYSSYLTLLKEKQKDIEAYTWQAYEEDKDGAPISVETKGIAIADVYGNSTPELLFIDAEENNGEGTAIRANLHIYSFQDGKPVEVAKKENLDYQVGGGAVYNIFLTEKDKRLYLEQIDFDAKETDVLYLLPVSGSFPLEWDRQASYSYDPEKGLENDETSPKRSDEEFILYDKPVEKTDYYAFKKRIEEETPKSLISNFGEEQKKETSAMSYSEAISFLEKQIHE